MRFESVVLLIGRPGAGKNEVGNMLEKNYGYKHIICSDVLGDDAEIANIKASGSLVSDDIVIDRMAKHLHTHAEVGPKLILNGATRTEAQAVGIVDMLQHQFDTGARIATFDIVTTQEQSWVRQLTRPDIRVDKNPDSIKKRDELYQLNEKKVHTYLQTYTRFYELGNFDTISTLSANLRLVMSKELAILRDRCPKSMPNFHTHVEAVNCL